MSGRPTFENKKGCVLASELLITLGDVFKNYFLDTILTFGDTPGEMCERTYHNSHTTCVIEPNLSYACSTHILYTRVI